MQVWSVIITECRQLRHAIAGHCSRGVDTISHSLSSFDRRAAVRAVTAASIWHARRGPRPVTAASTTHAARLPAYYAFMAGNNIVNLPLVTVDCRHWRLVLDNSISIIECNDLVRHRQSASSNPSTHIQATTGVPPTWKLHSGTEQGRQYLFKYRHRISDVANRARTCGTGWSLATGLQN